MSPTLRRQTSSLLTVFAKCPESTTIKLTPLNHWFSTTINNHPNKYTYQNLLSWECRQHVSKMLATCQNVNEFGNFHVRVPTPKFPRHKIFVSKIFNTVSHTRTYIHTKIKCPPKILTLETDYVHSNVTHLRLGSSCVVTIIANWSCCAHPPVILSCRFDINFDCCVCSHNHLLAAACIASVP
jgi:hypothetical protein